MYSCNRIRWVLSLFTLAFISFLSVQAKAQDERFEVGLSTGTSHVVAGETLKDAATSGYAQGFWLGYGFDKQTGIELGYDKFNFDRVNMNDQVISLMGIYRFKSESVVHPIFKLGLASFETKDAADAKTTAMGAKMAIGIEADVCKYASWGAAFNYFYNTKAGAADSLKDVQALVPSVFLTFHNEIEREKKSEAVAPSAAAVTAPVKKDTDGDGIVDEDDKCPSTLTGVVVNQFGCAEKEKASVKLNVEFALGKSNLDAKYNSEIEALAAFMKKFPETKVEIGGHSDSLGLPEKNLALSSRRANSVKMALIKSGVEANRLTSKGYGPEKPVADNKTEAGRAQNRRVMAEISVMSDKKK